MVTDSMRPPGLTEDATALSVTCTPLTRLMPCLPVVSTSWCTTRVPMGLLTWMPIEPSPVVLIEWNEARPRKPLPYKPAVRDLAAVSRG